MCNNNTASYTFTFPQHKLFRFAGLRATYQSWDNLWVILKLAQERPP